ncbi:DNA replication terminus site-binding protein [Rheinheimera sp. MMS21-TC3]|uniref:DNA replication terminus site-binding protein n=1 Tax=Rheinheimera sp. MMS21-TC3 TaxID=3072790 RepID=UPI0028C45D00|nr:DNA replication terminus site-binding protein [Rheinheimera sp. MMS21-TC3]WNO61034.1 DNA replication terminus site-binding protein [Rheinheimera sp. MMS21-TC3]
MSLSKPLLGKSDTTKINFSWTHRYSGKTFTRKELEKRILQAGARISEQVDAATGQSRQHIELQALANANHTEVFYQRRLLRVSPTAHIYTSTGTSARNIIAHSPIFIINQTPVIGTFNDYPNRTCNSYIRKLMPVIERLHIYCELP